MKCKNEIRCKGQFKNGKLHGKGTCYYPNGRLYIGDWLEGEATGKGKITTKNKDVYEG